MMRDFMAQSPYLVALAAAFLVQFSKFMAHYARHRVINFTRLVSTGGMPSSHSASVAALTTAVGFRDGTGSTLFAVTLFFSLVVMYDAAGVRRAAGLQARILNRIVQDHYEHRAFHSERLTELLGHTPVEVLAGAFAGVLFASLWYI